MKVVSKEDYFHTSYNVWDKARIVDRVSEILADFYRAPLSMASVQPILDLAVELNPELKEKK